MDRQTAKAARDEILQAVHCLNRSLALTEGHFPEATFEQMRRTAGLAIGRLETDYLRYIFELYPELDDIKYPASVDGRLDGSVVTAANFDRET